MSALLVRKTTAWLKITQFSLPILQSRNVSNRERLYGHEEGHDIHNEVRKERWIRRRMRRTMGGEWRESRGWDATGRMNSPLELLPDWHYADGRPGALSEKQKRYIRVQRDMVQDVFTCLDMVKTGKEAYAQETAAKEQHKTDIIEAKFKRKGDKTV